MNCRTPWLACLTIAAIAAGPATQPATAPGDEQLWTQLTGIDARAARIKSLKAEFEQQKFTPILRKPLVSAGSVRVRGSRLRWETRSPEPGVLLIDEHEARAYYPSQKTLEIYPLDSRLGELAASPLPRLAVLRARFAFTRIDPGTLDRSVDGSKVMALELTPTDASLREHVRQVRVLLDVSAGYILRAEFTDSDGDRTVLSFRDVQPNVDVGDLNLVVPPGTTVAHPLEGLDGSPRSQDKSK